MRPRPCRRCSRRTSSFHCGVTGVSIQPDFQAASSLQAQSDLRAIHLKHARISARRAKPDSHPSAGQKPEFHQSSRIVAWMLRHHLHGNLLERHSSLARVASTIATLAARHDRNRHAAGAAGFDLAERQIAKQEPLARRRRIVVQRALHFHPAERDTRRAIRSHQGVFEIVGPRAI